MLATPYVIHEDLHELPNFPSRVGVIHSYINTVMYVCKTQNA